MFYMFTVSFSAFSASIAIVPFSQRIVDLSFVVRVVVRSGSLLFVEVES